MNPRWQLSLRRYMLVVAALALLFAYVGSYYRLSRRGMSEAGGSGMPGFAYVPAQDIAPSVPTRAFNENAGRHFALYWFFVPLNWLDRKLFGAPPPYDCLMRLSG